MRMNNNKGVVLIMVLWVLVFLALVAWGLGRRSALEVSLLETYQGKLRSYAAARGGLNVVLDLLQRSATAKDALYSCGVNIDQTKTPEDIFGHIDTGNNTYAVVQWAAYNYNTNSDNPPLIFGLKDEEGAININAITAVNYQILSALLQEQANLSQADADKLTMAIISYSGQNALPGNNSSGFSTDTADDETALKPKNQHYENLLELLEVNGMTKEIFDKIKDDITVYGDIQNGLWINTDTASNDVIQAVVNAELRQNSSVNGSDIMREAYTVRDGADGVSFTVDDGVSSVAQLNDPNWPSALQEGYSGYYRARVIGIDTRSGVRSSIEAVIHHTQGAPAQIIAWQRD